MKIININESQKKRLFEAYDGKFSFKIRNLWSK